MGEIGILNVGAGDNRLVFDLKDPAGMIRAARVVKDMIRRGYALLIETGKDVDGKMQYRRAQDFDENTCEYIIADFDPVTAEQADVEEKDKIDEQSISGEAPTSIGKNVGRKCRKLGSYRRIPAASAGGVAVARSAGG